jgi:hypothetical protein
MGEGTSPGNLLNAFSAFVVYYQPIIKLSCGGARFEARPEVSIKSAKTGSVGRQAYPSRCL